MRFPMCVNGNIKSAVTATVYQGFYEYVTSFCRMLKSPKNEEAAAAFFILVVTHMLSISCFLVHSNIMGNNNCHK